MELSRSDNLPGKDSSLSRILFLHDGCVAERLAPMLASHFAVETVSEVQVAAGWQREGSHEAIVAALAPHSTALETLRALPALRDTPVILLLSENDANWMPDDVDDAVPIAASPQELISHIRATINCSRFHRRRQASDSQLLLEAKERLEGASAAGEVATWVWDITHNRLFGDSNLANIFGLEEPPATPPPIEFYTAAIHIEDREHVVRTLRDCIRDKASFRYEVDHRIMRPNGEIRFLSVRARVDRDAAGWALRVAGAALDVTEREKAERGLKRSEERLQQGVQAARMAVWEWDIVTGQVTFLGNALSVLGGAWDTAEEGFNHIHPDDQQRLQYEVESAIERRGEYRTEVRMIRPDNGETIWIEAHGKVLCDVNGVPNAIRGLSLDITTRKRAEEELVAADKRKDEFLAMLAHELRNPLAPISTAAQLLNSPSIDHSMARKASEIISRQAAHISHLMDDLLDVSRVTRGLVSLEKKVVDFRDIISDAIEQARPQIQARHHRLKTHIVEESAVVQGDSTRLIQIVTNLLNNAAKFTPESGEILLQLDIESDRVLLNITDNGIGITSDLLPHVFELFTQGKRSPDRSQGGLGLGLALVKRLVELHGGTVSAHSAGAGQGSEFRISLPRWSVRDESQDHIPEQTAQQDSSSIRILIVDDNVDAAESLALLMQSYGHQATAVFNAHSALELARTNSPQVLLLDIGLPDMDGYTLARRLRTLPQTAHAVYVAVSGYGQPQDVLQSKAAGFDHHLAKPAAPENLLEIIARAGAAQ